MEHFQEIFYACVTILLTLGLAMIIKLIWKCTHKTNNSQEKFHRLELRQFFENKSEVVNEERSNIGSDNQETPSEQDKIVHFPV